MHVEICDVSCVIVKTVKTQKQIEYKKKKIFATQLDHQLTPWPSMLVFQKLL